MFLNALQSIAIPEHKCPSPNRTGILFVSSDVLVLLMAFWREASRTAPEQHSLASGSKD